MGRTSAEDPLGWAGHKAGLLMDGGTVWRVRNKGLATQGSRQQASPCLWGQDSLRLSRTGQLVPDQLITWELLEMQSPGLCPSHLISISKSEAQSLPAHGSLGDLVLAYLLHGWPAAGSHSNLREGH